MLSQDLQEELSLFGESADQIISERYLVLLNKYAELSNGLQASAQELTEKGFIKAVKQQGMCTHLVSKQMLMIQNRLLGYVLDYYDAANKAEQIRHADYSSGGDIRFDLLTTRAIKSKAQFKTIARALAKTDYKNLQSGVGLAEFDWGHEKLT
ncbi:hypothetical protein GCM10009114_34370 [Aliiglaciecola litoralis]|uniref:Uncharacterized protein n=2 Tax=Aliiglaciecola litoralis TaxID=582857 RepID=A0ABN1LSW6_9ALTE